MAPDGRKRQVDLAQAARLFPTPTSADGQRESQNYVRGNPTLKGAAMLPTPRAEGFDAGAHRGTPDSLHSRVKDDLLPTPTRHGNNNRAGASAKSGDGLATRARMLPTPVHHEARLGYQDRSLGMKGSQESLTTVVFNENETTPATSGVKLNPDWVSRMMGYPDGWMDGLPADPLAHLVPTGKRASRARTTAAHRGEND